MFHRFNYFLLIFTIFITCFITKQTLSNNSYDFKNKPAVKVTKAKIRFDYEGQYRSFSSFFYSIPDSILTVEIKTVLGSTLHKLIATPQEVIFTNEIDKVSYHLDYKYLSNNLRFKIDFFTLQSIFSGHNSNLNQYIQSNKPVMDMFLINQNNSKLKNEAHIYFAYNLITQTLNEFIIAINVSNYLFSSSYTWDPEFSNEAPHTINLFFLFNQREVDLEIDNKNIYFDSILPTFVDTIYTSQYLTEF